MKPYSNRYDHIQSFIDDYQSHVVVSKREHHEDTIISISPSEPNQANIAIYIANQATYIDIEAGIGFHVNDAYWRDFPVDRILRAIAAGQLVEYVRLFNHTMIGISGYLTVTGEDAPLYDNHTYSLIGEIAYLYKKRRKEIRYAPYGNPSRIEG